MNAISPSSECAGSAVQPSFAAAGLPVKTKSPLPESGGGGKAGTVRAWTRIRGACTQGLRTVGRVGIARQRIAVRVRHGLEGRARSVVVRVSDEVEAAAHLAARPEAPTEFGQRVV